MSSFTQSLVVSPLADGKTWVLRTSFYYAVGDVLSENTVEVPVGFMSDFASIPRWLWWVFPPWGKYGNAAIIHDWLYWNQSTSRKEADLILLQAMTVLGVGGWYKYPIYWAVYLFGYIAWKRNQLDKKAGFNRITAEPEIKVTYMSKRPGLVSRLLKH
ncbi:MAG: hypothetical protein A2020_14780 [Lentisphaerae bacterium GWF2_45_14]|nr:MAG: hypothetical protein A2020_14780 [Lentisphaerae bacterium GWF2_45_14]